MTKVKSDVILAMAPCLVLELIQVYIGVFSNEGVWTNVGNNYPDILGKGRSIFTGDPNNRNNRFKNKEIEIFKFYK